MDSKTESAFAVASEEYLDKHHIKVYFKDAISQLLEHAEENPKVEPAKFFYEYFTSIRHGEHTLLRDYNFIRATPHNRSSFIRSFWKCFRPIGKNGGLLNVKEYHSLICLLCPDFPFDILQKTAQIILMDDAMDCLMSFSDFLYAFQLQFYFETFLESCSHIYQELIQDSSTQMTKTEIKTANSEGISSKAFMDAISYSIYRKKTGHQFSCPPESSIQEMLSSVDVVSFYGFLMALTKHPAVNASVGILPDKTRVMDFNDKDATSRSSPRPLSSKPPRPPSRTKPLI